MSQRTATLYRMVLPDYVCPSGALARQMLEQGGYEIDERILATQIEAEVFAAEHDGAPLPQIFIGGVRVGGCDELARYLARSEARA